MTDTQQVLSIYYADAILSDLLTHGRNYLALHESNPSALGLISTEVAGGDYRRQPISFAALADKVAASINSQTFVGMPGCLVTHLAVWDDPVAGHLMFVIKLNPALGVLPDGHFLVTAGDIGLRPDVPTPVVTQLPPVIPAPPVVPPIVPPVTTPRPTPAPVPAPGGASALVYEDQFASLDATAWSVYDNSTFGAPTRVQLYLARNARFGVGSPGSTGGTSLKLLSKRESVAGHAFTAAMLDSKSAGRYLPRYLRCEARMKIPHGQGLWPAWWLTARIGGAGMVELDLMEGFHSQIPGKILTTLHRSDNAGVPRSNVAKNYGGTFFEEPTSTPGWHTVAVEVAPAAGDFSQPNTAVRIRGYLDGAKYFDYLDTQALYWSTHGGDENSFWNVYLQGCQIDGEFVGSPDGPLGYSHWKNICLAGGAAPDACSTVVGGHAMRLPTFGDPSSTFEIDYHKVWKLLG